ncbi:MAG: hypothetical protein AUJ52_11955 [Elusimicrobia bacterium CG1_02_63_36]|nr:MAG: hypothetical protein AUJ52_11955 [Elusimicrobia bacterium CG1_02_63_36]PIP83745.1 MAG: hypothetical protein COR54_07795 [Elusimicrobia bacterium CG22_combo_CG10-13_8_21_14_all_63_91]PJA17157.1 MAG: hypothetical protein COX66_05720 [Elusimicrobia bacterium CG_4_10_14_0_2_um_filter_63_34]PJB25937.1 MAG: hypothetical protein CO113_06195 [Elusimicrobia bacterium CG_4_9_14_3_um_filter_62_55]
MKNLVYSLIASAVVTGSGWTLTSVVAERMPEKARDAILAPGEVLVEKLEDRKDFRKLRKQGKKAVTKGRKRLSKAQDELQEKLEDSGVEFDLDRKAKLYNVSVWALVGFGLCALLTLALGVSSFMTAVSLGIKVSLAMLFLQGALVFGGILALQSIR